MWSELKAEKLLREDAPTPTLEGALETSSAVPISLE
jgi:hypothetical protein